MKSEKLETILFLIAGAVSFVQVFEIVYFDNLLIPSVVYLLAGYLLSIKHFDEKNNLLFSISFPLFLTGVAMLAESIAKIRHFYLFATFVFFAIIALLLVVLYVNNRKRLIYLPLVLIDILIAAFYLGYLPSAYLKTLYVSISNILVFAPFVLLFVGYVKLRKFL